MCEREGFSYSERPGRNYRSRYRPLPSSSRHYKEASILSYVKEDCIGGKPQRLIWGSDHRPVKTKACQMHLEKGSLSPNLSLHSVQLLCIYLCLHPTTRLKSWPGAKCAQLQNDAYLFLALKQRRNCAARSYTSAVAAVLWTLAFYWPPINLPGPQTTQSNLGRKNDRCLKLKTQLKLWVKGGQHKATVLSWMWWIGWI